MKTLSRREVLAAGMAGCACCSAFGAILPLDTPALLDAGYQPVDKDERGLWQDWERLEEELATSSNLFVAPDLKDYTREILARLVGPVASEIRIYLVRDASFNASMTPNGILVVHSGFIARARNEAQYAAVLGHEAGHYFRKHSLHSYRNLRTKANVSAFVAMGATAAGGYAAINGYNGQSWIDLANAINAGLVASVFEFSRAQETEADAYGLSLLIKADYTPDAASQVWKQLIEERQRSAAVRDKRYRANRVSAFSTHPPEALRMRDLQETADLARSRDMTKVPDDGATRWREVVAPYRNLLLGEQIKLNDPGASLYLIESHAQDGWNGLLRYHEGEIYRLRNDKGDPEKAAESYAAAVEFPDAPAAAWRAHGYALIKAGRTDEGRLALTRYLEINPDAGDASMVRFSIGQQRNTP